MIGLREIVPQLADLRHSLLGKRSPQAMIIPRVTDNFEVPKRLKSFSGISTTFN
jgi:hypothetical protein